MNGSSECILVHRSNFTHCETSDTFTAKTGSGFGTSGPSFSSTLRGTAIRAMDGTLVECFGPANNVDPGNRVDGSALQILGQYHSVE